MEWSQTDREAICAAGGRPESGGLPTDLGVQPISSDRHEVIGFNMFSARFWSWFGSVISWLCPSSSILYWKCFCLFHVLICWKYVACLMFYRAHSLRDYLKYQIRPTLWIFKLLGLLKTMAAFEGGLCFAL